MVYIIIVVLAVVVLGFAWWRKRNPPSFDYVPDEKAIEEMLSGGTSGIQGRLPWKSVATPAEETAEIEHREFTYDAADDLLDPRNPQHAEWLKSHPDAATDADRAAEQSEDPPSA